MAEEEAFDLAREMPWTGIAAAFLWVALASLVYVPTAEPGLVTASVAGDGVRELRDRAVVLAAWSRVDHDELYTGEHERIAGTEPHRVPEAM